jgi:mRNA-degrading endonuclease RelE of RelBE toxin-antitoxin system
MAKKVDWHEDAKRDLRGIDRESAMRILHGIARYAKSGEGDVKRLQDVDPPELRLRVGDYRVRYHDYGDFIYVLSVKHRREAYR